MQPNKTLKTLIIITFICLLNLLNINTLQGQEASIKQLTGRTFFVNNEKVADGLKHTHYLATAADGLPLSIHILTVDLSKIKIEITLAGDQIMGQETVSSMVMRNDALAGVNGGFSFSNDPWNLYHGDPRDFFVLDGKILSEPYSTRSSFGIRTNEHSRQIPLISRLGLKMTVQINGEKMNISGINRKRGKDELILYTPEWHRTTLTSQHGTELIIQDKKINKIFDLKGSSTMPKNGFILSASGKYTDSLRNAGMKPGMKIHIDTSLASLDEKNNHATTNVNNTSYTTAGPTLIRKGKRVDNIEAENIRLAFDTTSHPRTAIGITKGRDSLFLMTADGRQPGYSMGMSLDQVSQFLIELGTWSGYNLDGGGSTTMAIRNIVVNSFSDPRERRRCDAILLYPVNKK